MGWKIREKVNFDEIFFLLREFDDINAYGKLIPFYRRKYIWLIPTLTLFCPYFSINVSSRTHCWQILPKTYLKGGKRLPNDTSINSYSFSILVKSPFFPPNLKAQVSTTWWTSKRKSRIALDLQLWLDGLFWSFLLDFNEWK